jgi:hypothetical protein
MPDGAFVGTTATRANSPHQTRGGCADAGHPIPAATLRGTIGASRRAPPPLRPPVSTSRVATSSEGETVAVEQRCRRRVRGVLNQWGRWISDETVGFATGLTSSSFRQGWRQACVTDHLRALPTPKMTPTNLGLKRRFFTPPNQRTLS